MNDTLVVMGFTHLKINNIDRLTYTWGKIDENTLELKQDNNKKSIATTDPVIIAHLNAINEYLQRHLESTES